MKNDIQVWGCHRSLGDDIIDKVYYSPQRTLHQHLSLTPDTSTMLARPERSTCVRGIGSGAELAPLPGALESFERSPLLSPWTIVGVGVWGGSMYGAFFEGFDAASLSSIRKCHINSCSERHSTTNPDMYDATRKAPCVRVKQLRSLPC